ncbi:MAG TPA: hypothetical protein VFB16_13620 [Bauldia sp.]|nr:hypothetical protein [Bauldia sp.]
MKEKKGTAPHPSEKARRQARLAEALRANLRRRKQAGKAAEPRDSGPAENAGRGQGSLNRP